MTKPPCLLPRQRQIGGPVVDRRYLVLERLGVGGTAVVYCAEDLLQTRNVVLKVLHEWLADDQEAVARFRREASTGAELDHPNIVSTYGSGEWHGRQYIVLEHVSGGSLRLLVREQAPLAPLTAVELVVQLLLAVGHIHSRGIIHRDLKPDNVIVDSRGEPKLTDFGIARACESDLTPTGNVLGTAHYMSPEQALGQPVGNASDLYALGVILYELLTGRVPFQAENAVAVLYKHVNEQPTPPSLLNPAVPGALDPIIARALEKEPSGRFTSAEVFIEALATAQVRAAAERAILSSQ